jgi:hypothetical protein
MGAAAGAKQADAGSTGKRAARGAQLADNGARIQVPQFYATNAAAAV